MALKPTEWNVALEEAEAACLAALCTILNLRAGTDAFLSVNPGNTVRLVHCKTNIPVPVRTVRHGETMYLISVIRSDFRPEAALRCSQQLPSELHRPVQFLPFS